MKKTSSTTTTTTTTTTDEDRSEWLKKRHEIAMKLNKTKKVQAKNIPDSNQWKKAIEKADEIEEKILRNPAYGKGYELDNIKDTKKKRRINWKEKIKRIKDNEKKSSMTTTTTTTTTYNTPKESTKYPEFPGAVDLDERLPPPKKPTEFAGAVDLDKPTPQEVIDLVSTDEDDDTETEDEDNADTEPYDNVESGNKLKF